MTHHQQVNGSIEQQAADWFLLMQSDQIPDETQLHAFLDWLKNPEAEVAYGHCESVWELSGTLNNDETFSASRAKNDKIVTTGLIQSWPKLSTNARYGLQAACLAVLAIAVLWTGSLTKEASFDVYQTATGQRADYTLADGTLISLNTASEVHVSYRNDARKVILARGEVLFDVAKDAHRPFSVTAGNGEITALGTIFNVKKSNSQSAVEVALLEGRVEVKANVSDGHEGTVEQKQLMSASDVLSYSRNSIAPVEKIADPDKVTEWKEGRLSFTDATLAEVIFEVNRYNISKLIIDEVSLQEERIDAYFEIGDTEALLSALQETVDIRWSYRADGIFLYRDTPIE